MSEPIAYSELITPVGAPPALDGARGEDLTLDGKTPGTKRALFSWALFEWARNPFPILVVIYVFAPYFSRSIVGDPVRAQSLLGLAASVTGVVVAVLAPVLGAIADKHGRRKPWLIGLVAALAPAAALLWFAKPGGAGLGVVGTLALIGVATFCFEFSQVFHNAMLTSIAPARRIGALSGLALALGNAAGVLLMATVLFAFSPGSPLSAIFKPGAHVPERLVGPIAAGWLVLFSLPLFLFTPDAPAAGRSLGASIRLGVSELAKTLTNLSRHRNAALYLLARMIFNDGLVGILTFGGVYATGVFGWAPTTMLVFGIITSIVAVVGGLIGGRLDDRLGSKRTLLWSLALVIVLWAVQLSFRRDSIFYIVSIKPDQPIWGAPLFRTLPELLYLLNNQVFGIVLTVAISSSRAMLARVAPREMMTQFFGLYALSGSATGFIAPLLVGAATLATHSQRGGVASLILLLATGALILARVQPGPAHASPAA